MSHSQALHADIDALHMDVDELDASSTQALHADIDALHVHVAAFARRRRIRQQYHADADAATFGRRLESAKATADADAANATATSQGMDYTAKLLDADALDAQAVGVGFYL